MTITIKRVIGGRLITRQAAESGYVTAGEAAALLRVELRWVYALIKTGRLPARKPRGRVLIPVQSVLTYAKARTRRREGGEDDGNKT